MEDGAVGQVRRPAAALRREGRSERFRTLYYVAATVLAALVPLILFAGLWIRSELNNTRRDVEDFLRSRAEALSNRVDADIRQQISVLQAIAAMPSLDEPNLVYFHAAATRMAASMPQWTFIALFDAGGEPLLDSLRPLGAAIPVFATPETIRSIATSRKPAIRTERAGIDGLKSGPVVLLFVPVVRDDGVKFVLVAGMEGEVVQQLLLQVTPNPSFLSVIVDEQGDVLARSRSPEQWIGEQAGAPLLRSAAGRGSGLFVASTPEGHEVLTAFQRSQLTGWLSVAATDRRQLDALARNSNRALIATGALSLTLAGVLAVFLVYHFVERRLSDERLAASRALGELDARLLATSQQSLSEQRKASSEREVLLREIYHRVKNNLQIIQSLLRLGARDLAPGQREPFENAIRRIGAMARVHTLLYNSPDLASIDLADYLDGLAGELAEAFGAEERGIRTALDIRSMRVPLDLAVPLAFIAVEFLTNAFRHAFPPGREGTITVRAFAEGGTGVLTVSDDGIGVPVGNATFRHSLGFTIVRRLVEQIDGTLDEPQAGRSAFTVRFPLPPAAT